MCSRLIKLSQSCKYCSGFYAVKGKFYLMVYSCYFFLFYFAVLMLGIELLALGMFCTHVSLSYPALE